jgi:uncharacterized protein YraI
MTRSLILAAIVIFAGAIGASAQERCRVMDPTGTPLNVRTGPNSTIIGTLPNGMLVTVLDRTRDARGRPWVYVANYRTGRPIGWVFREFIACF